MKNKKTVFEVKKRESAANSLTVSTSEAADLLGVCPRTVSNLTRRGELPVIRIAGCVRYCRQALADFVQQKSVRVTSGGSESTDFTLDLGEVA